MRSAAFLTILWCIGAASQQAKNPFNIISGATLFTGPASPIVDLGYAKYRGKDDAGTQTSNYLGVKYANAPRFDHSTVFAGNGTSADQVIDASEYGPACAQHEATSILAPSDLGLGKVAGILESTPLFLAVQKQSEDCLSLNIQRPKDASLQNLPVMVWIHGGGFEAGASSSVISETSAAQGVFYQGASIIKRSIDMKQPILFVSLNYRLAHFGFTASKEFADAGLLNLGFEDQRNAFRWIQQNIAKFGGDPSKVTIMGESAGSWSVSAHLVANDGDNEGLFRSAIGMSGGPLKVEGPERQQILFDDLVKYAACDRSQNKVQCLREAPFEKIYAHMGTVNYFLEGYRSLASAWTLRPGCKLLPQSPDRLAATGKIANVPLLMGDMRDEGPLFSLITALNTTTDDDVKDYFKTYWWPNVSEDQLNRLLELYPQNPTKGSPYGTGIANAVTPQFKRIASIVGDYSFEAQRRQFFSQHKGPKWSYQTEVALPLPLIDDTFLGGLIGTTGLTHFPVLGSFHAFDVLFYLFGTLPDLVSKNSKNIMTTWISFVHNNDPNIHDLKNAPHWPPYETDSKKLYHFQETGLDVITDDYRQEQMDYINEIGDDLRI